MVQVVFCMYISIFPLICVQNTVMDQSQLSKLMLFDVIFVVDRFLNYFEGYYNPNG